VKSVMTLEDYKKTLELCFRCSRCKWICDWDIKSARFSSICPSLKRFLFDAYSAQGRIDIARALLTGDLDYSDKLLEIVYACTLCGGCDITCKRSKGEMEPLRVLYELRAKCVADGKGPLRQHLRFAQSIEEHHNPYDEPHEGRFNLIGRKSTPRKQNGIGYFIGCTAAYKVPRIAKSALSIMNKLGMNVSILGSEEYCCGGPLYRVGLTEKAKESMQHSLEAVKKLGLGKVVFTCPGCYDAFKSIYPKLGGKVDFEPVHIVDFLARTLDQQRIKLKRIRQQVTYHDPCHLGRFMDVYEQPRKILQAIPGLKLVEMERNRDNSWCCGAGGGVKSAFGEFALWSANERLEEAQATRSDTVVTACPFCELNLSQAANASGKTLQVRDILELVDEAITF